MERYVKDVIFSKLNFIKFQDGGGGYSGGGGAGLSCLNNPLKVGGNGGCDGGDGERGSGSDFPSPGSGSGFDLNSVALNYFTVSPTACHEHKDSQGGGGAGVTIEGHGQFGDGDGGTSVAQQGVVILEFS